MPGYAPPYISWIPPGNDAPLMTGNAEIDAQLGFVVFLIFAALMIFLAYIFINIVKDSMESDT